MNVLWIVNQLISDAAKKFNRKSTSGTWLESALQQHRNDSMCRLIVSTVHSDVKEMVYQKADVEYYVLPRGTGSIYDYQNPHNIQLWRKVVKESAPDIIVIWGTEYAHGMCALLAAPEVPSVIVIQGVLASVAHLYMGSMTTGEILSAYSLRNFLKQDSLWQEQKLYHKKAKIERKMIERAGNVLIENQWAINECKCISPSCNIYVYKTLIQELFFDYQWQYDSCNKNTIFCTAPGGYPLKGFHTLIKALAIVRKQIPDVSLMVPGMKDPFHIGLRGSIKQKGYLLYIKRLIAQYRLGGTIHFLGDLSPTQMAEQLCKANIFVLPSYVENQSMSLREAMAVGTPCIASYVGGVPEIIQHGKNGYLYRAEEITQLAQYIIRLLSAGKSAEVIANQGRVDIHKYYRDTENSQSLINICKTIITKEKSQ